MGQRRFGGGRLFRKNFLCIRLSAQDFPLPVQHLPAVEGDKIRGELGIALTEGGADAALAASLFHYKELEIRQVKDYLAAKGVSVRR